jgi:hypothetical protein
MLKYKNLEIMIMTAWKAIFQILFKRSFNRPVRSRIISARNEPRNMVSLGINPGFDEYLTRKMERIKL